MDALRPKRLKWCHGSLRRFGGRAKGVCKGRWLEIRHGLKSCYAQWEDVGPFRTDSAGYVFGNERPLPNANRGARIDVSPGVRDHLEIGSLDVVDWRFVEQAEVPGGPWSLYDRSENLEASL
jgi:hypothetical protein